MYDKVNKQNNEKTFWLVHDNLMKMERSSG